VLARCLSLESHCILKSNRNIKVNDLSNKSEPMDSVVLRQFIDI